MHEWPASKFEALYEAYSRRKIADALSARRDSEIAALWGNTNMDTGNQDNIRQKYMDNIDEQFSKAIAAIYGQGLEDENVDWDDPFLAPTKKALEDVRLPTPDKE